MLNSRAIIFRFHVFNLQNSFDFESCSSVLYNLFFHNRHINDKGM